MYKKKYLLFETDLTLTTFKYNGYFCRIFMSFLTFEARLLIFEANLSNITFITQYQRWAIPSTKVPRYFFSTVSVTDDTFFKMLPKYRYRSTF